MKNIGILTVCLLGIVYSTILNGWALAKLWLWFLVPTFGFPALSIPQAIGVALIVAYVTKNIEVNEEEAQRPLASRLGKSFFVSTAKPIFSLLFGAIVCRFL